MSGIELLLDSNRGTYIPQAFAEQCGEKWGLTDKQKEVLADPDHEWYWETWTEVLDNATCTVDGKTYHLHQDGDVWAYCRELMSPEEISDFFGEEE